MTVILLLGVATLLAASLAVATRSAARAMRAERRPRVRDGMSAAWHAEQLRHSDE